MFPSTDTPDSRLFAAEIKFLVDRPVGAAVREWARARLAPDPYANGPQGDGYRTTSVYFDNGNFDVANRRGSTGRCKYRVRRYGEHNFAFLERKLRTPRFLTKRRTVISLDDLDLLDAPSADRDWSGRWFHQRLLARELRPVCHLTYERTALVGESASGPLRLTIDDDVQARPVTSLAFGDEAGFRVLDEHVVLELKYRVALPALFKELVAEFGLASGSVSKYRLAARQLGFVPPDSRGASPTQTEASPSC